MVDDMSSDQAAPLMSTVEAWMNIPQVTFTEHSQAIKLEILLSWEKFPLTSKNHHFVNKQFGAFEKGKKNRDYLKLMFS